MEALGEGVGELAEEGEGVGAESQSVRLSGAGTAGALGCLVSHA